MATQLRDGSTVEDPRFDRIPEPDERDRLFSVMDIVGGQEHPVSVDWEFPPGTPVLDQGREGACVGYGCANELRCNPVPVLGLDGTWAREQLYWPAQRDDPWPGGSYPGAQPQYEGTSVRAGVKRLAQLGYVGEYRWAKNEEEMALAISAGPIIIGVDWYRGMTRPDAKGYLNATGAKIGGHCCLVIGLKVTAPATGPLKPATNRPGSGYYTIYNSWGPNWGTNGTARIRRGVMAKLIADGGEACLITERFNPPRSR